MSHVRTSPFYADGHSTVSKGTNHAYNLGGGAQSMGCIGYIEDFPYTTAPTTSLDGPILEHPFRRPFTVTWEIDPDTFVVDYEYLPLHKSCIGISDSNLWYTPIIHCHQDHRLQSLTSLGGSEYIATLRSSFCIRRRPTPLLLFRGDVSSALPRLPIWGVGVLVDPSTVPGALISTYYLMVGAGFDFVSIPITDPWSYLDSTPGFVFTSATSGTLTVTF